MKIHRGLNILSKYGILFKAFFREEVMRAANFLEFINQ